MANAEHLAVLQQGVDVWNAWRAQHRDIIPDLREARLSRANLSEAALSGADLSRANLSGAVFTEAVLWETIFGDTDLTSAQGLEACRHQGPSTLDHRTLAKSGPLGFQIVMEKF